MFSKNLESKSPAGPINLCDHITLIMVRGEERTSLALMRGTITLEGDHLGSLDAGLRLHLDVRQ